MNRRYTLHAYESGVIHVTELYTRKGDDGSTALPDGTRVRKDDKRIRAYGAIDELNSHLGVAVSFVATAVRTKPTEPAWKALHDRLVQVQGELLSLGAELTAPADVKNRGQVPPTTAEQVARLEAWIDEATASADPLKTFILPGGDVVAAHLHVCRTACRRAERYVVALAEGTQIDPQVVAYINRLSDLLFAWARQANHIAGVPEEPRNKPKAKRRDGHRGE